MRKVLDVGHGGVPFGNPLNAEFSSFAARFPAGYEYHGIDNPYVPSDPLKRPGQIVKNEQVAAIEEASGISPHPRIYFHRMDARALSFAAFTFSEAHLHSFVTDPRVTERDVKAVLLEVHRVLVEGGICLISGEKGRSIEPKWLATAMAAQELGFSTAKGTIEGLSAFATDISMNPSFEGGAFIGLLK